MGKIIKVLNLEKGVQTIELPYTEDQEKQAIQREKFKVENTYFDGWCPKCGQAVMIGNSSILVCVDGVGNVYAEVFHKACSSEQ